MIPAQQFSNSPVRVSRIIGTEVINSSGENLGAIREVVIDSRTSMVSYAVVSFGGFLGLNKKLFAIPFSAFDYNAINDQYVLDVPREKLQAAPGFDADQWPTMSDEMWNRDLHKYYSRPPYRE